jgi:hypothetical protein
MVIPVIASHSSPLCRLRLALLSAMFVYDVRAEKMILHLMLDKAVPKTQRYASSFGPYIQKDQGR